MLSADALSAGAGIIQGATLMQQFQLISRGTMLNAKLSVIPPGSDMLLLADASRVR